jgi:hypothetical protein
VIIRIISTVFTITSIVIATFISRIVNIDIIKIIAPMTARHSPWSKPCLAYGQFIYLDVNTSQWLQIMQLLHICSNKQVIN